MQDKEARTGGRTYLGYLLFRPFVCSCRPLVGVTLAGWRTDHDGFSGRRRKGRSVPQTTQMILLLLFTFGFAKAGIMPAHLVARCHGCSDSGFRPPSCRASSQVGVFCLYRVYADIFGFEVLRSLDGEDWMIGIARAILISSLSPVSGQLEAPSFFHHRPTRLCCLGLPAAHNGAVSVLHIAMHACGKITLFFCREPFSWPRAYCASELRGLGRKMPTVMGAFMIGFERNRLAAPRRTVSKWYLALGFGP